MGIKVEYVGARSYTEFRYGNKAVGFARGMVRELEDAAIPTIRQLVDNGSTMWKIVGDTVPDKTEAMKATIEPTVEETVVEEEESADVDYASMSRAALMSLAKERGHTTKNTMKKADLVELLSA
jgi:hypothetical protein